jgi:CRP/FNR family cyclic AMP-dependent transcriptional regulator
MQHWAPVGALGPRTVEFRPGQRIATQGEEPECLYLVREGVVKLASTSTHGREAVLGLVGPGGVFGERALLQWPAPPGGQATGAGPPAATALTRCAVSVVPLLAMRDGIELNAILEAMAARLSETSGALERLLHHEALPRLAGVLADLAERFGTTKGHGIEIRVPLAQHDLASMVGASRETVNRSLAALRAMGWVDRVGSRLLVEDLEALRRFAQEGP